MIHRLYSPKFQHCYSQNQRKWSQLAVLAGLCLAIPLLLVLLPASPARAAGEVCFATINAVTVYSSTNAAAVRDALAAAAAGNVVKVAGTCAGAVLESGTTQVALITKTLTVRGGYTTTNWATSNPAANPTTLDAQNAGRVIRVFGAGVNPTLENLNLINGNAGSGDGGGVFASSALTLTNVNVISNTGGGGNGGGGAFALNAVVNGGRFERNISTGSGGGLRASSATLNGTEFISNTGTFGGGLNAGLVILNGGRFEQNEAGIGGGVYSLIDLTMTGTDFISNRATTQGGGVNANGAATVSGGRFENNQVLNGSGGGLLVIATLNLTNTEFVSNTTGGNGGGAAVSGLATLSGGWFERNRCTGGGCFGGGIATFNTLTLAGTQFLSNTAQGSNGGGAYVSQGGANVSGSEFVGNQAQVNGGGLLVANGLVTINGTKFISNTAVTGYGGGTGISGNTTIVDSYFERNQAQTAGGGARIFSTLTLTGSQFVSNTAIANDGGGAAIDGVGTVTDSWFERNQSNTYGGGLDSNTILNLFNTTFISNTTGTNGGGAISAGTGITMTGGLVENNRCTGANCDGGGLLTFGPLTVTGGQFISNTTNRLGGGLAVDALIMNGTELIGNTGGSKGGGAYSDSTSTVTGSHFENNRCLNAGCTGGGLDTASHVTATNTSFISNTAHTGGGISLGGAITLNNGLFERNWAVVKGGGLFVVSHLNLLGTQFISNTAATNVGGGISVQGGTVNLARGSFRGNQAQVHGGGVDVLSGTVTVDDTEFISNTAMTGHGGGIGSSHGITLTNSYFERNSAATGGGGVRTFALLNATNTNFVNNIVRNASGDGGAAYVNGAVTLLDSQFAGNQAPDDGGALLGATTLTATNTIFDNNRATSAGGAGGGAAIIGAVSLNGGRFANNTAAGGGGLYTANGSLTMANTQFLSNTTTGHGGGIQSAGVTVLDGGLFQNNHAGGNGGGLSTPGTVTLTHTQFISNSAIGDGVTAGGGALAASGAITITGGQFIRNTANTAHGGAVWTNNGLNVSQATFLDNAALTGNGGGLAQNGSGTGRVVNSLFGRNQANNGAALSLNSSGNVELLHNTIADMTLNPAPAIIVNVGTVGITNTIIANHSKGIQRGGGLVNEDYNLFSGNGANTAGGVTSGGHSLTGNPGFANPALNDYHLTPNSAAVNAGLDAGLALDFEDHGRPQAGGFDIGYDESPHISQADLSITKTAIPNIAAPGQLITYILSFTNNGSQIGSGIVITDLVPLTLTNISSTTQGVTLTPTAGLTYAWTVADLTPGAGGVITLTGIVSPGLVGDTTFANTAQISGITTDENTLNNTATAVVTVTRPQLAFSSAAYGVAENAGPAVITVTLIPASLTTTTVTYTTTGGGTATPGADYLITSGLLTFSPGTTALTFTVPISDDGEDEPDETINLSLSNPSGANLTPPANAAVLTILDNDEPSLPTIHLPVILKSFIFAPDLVVDNLIADSNGVTVIIKNIGTMPVEDAFRVDVYIDPSPAPTGVNQEWPQLAGQGLVWEVTESLAVGESLTLSIDGPYYLAAQSSFNSPLTFGTPVWAQVDVAGPGDFGRVLEIHETIGLAYNNIANTLSILGGGSAAD